MAYVKSVVAGALFLGFWLWLVPFRWIGVQPTPPPPWRLVAGAALVLVGGVICAACVFRFARTGRGTPAPMDPPRRLVVIGPYGWVRNPMYLGFVLLLLGEATLYGSVEIIVLLAVLVVALHGFVLWYEEPGLERRFGEEYRLYRRQVRRWIPGPPRREGGSAPVDAAGVGDP